MPSLVKTVDSGIPGPSLAFVYCMHGDEVVGKVVADRIRQLPLLKGKVVFIIANPDAYKQEKRFVESDLNRVFPGTETGTYEEVLAHGLTKVIAQVDHLIDIHGTTGLTDPYAIVTKYDQVLFDLIRSAGIANVVLMGEYIASGRSMLDSTKSGFSVEYYTGTPRQSWTRCMAHVKNLLVGLGLLPGKKPVQNELRFFKVVGEIPRHPHFQIEDDVRNFQLVKAGSVIGYYHPERLVAGDDFYPIFYGEKTYATTVCYKTVKLDGPPPPFDKSS